MKNHFDLEEDIMKCWEIVDDLKMISKQTELSKEEYTSLIESLHTLYSLKFTELFNTFEQCIKNKELE